MRLLTDLARGCADLLYPPMCIACEQPCRDALCRSCRDLIAVDPFPSCPRCAATVGPYADTDDGCSNCRGRGFAFAGAVRLGPYEGLCRDLILRMKHDELTARAVGAVFAECIAPVAKKWPISTVTCVPLHWIKKWRRGYNQAEVLARMLAGAMDVRCRPRLLVRRRATLLQTGLSRTARQENLRGAISSRNSRKIDSGRIALLVDDVVTTGATVNAAAIGLKSAGFEKVYVAAVAHG